LFSFSAENEHLFSLSFWFRTENDLQVSAPVSFTTENVKSIFGRSLPSMTSGLETERGYSEEKDTAEVNKKGKYKQEKKGSKLQQAKGSK